LRKWLVENQAPRKNGSETVDAKSDSQESEIVSISISFNQITKLKPNETFTEVLEVVDKLLPQQDLINVARRICTGSDGELFKRVLGTVTGGSLSSRLSEAASRNRRRGKYLWSDVDRVILAELSHRMDGGIDSNRYRHVMIDEAQDLTRLELRVLSNFTKASEISLVGDLNQATKIGYLGSWQEIASELGITDLRIVNLQHNYRIPENIYDYARMYLDEDDRIQTPTCDLEGGVVEIVSIPNRRYESTVNELVEKLCDNGERVAVISGDPRFISMFNEQNFPNATCLTPEDVKGLEVDHAIVLRPNTWYRPTGRLRNLMYVALTRATKTVTILDSSVGTSDIVRI
jgi:DNA helicase IV